MIRYSDADRCHTSERIRLLDAKLTSFSFTATPPDERTSGTRSEKGGFMADQRIESIVAVLRHAMRRRLKPSERSDLQRCIEELKRIDEQLSQKPPPDRVTRGLLIGSILARVAEVVSSIINA